MSPPPTRDYGVTAQAGISWPAKIAFVIGVVLAVGGAAAVLGRVWWEDRNDAVANAKEWTIAGPPCPQLSAEAFQAGGYKARKGSEFNGVTFMRAAGHLSCNEVASNGGKGLGKYVVCQFTGPSVLTVRTAKGEFFFNPGPGQNTTVEVRDAVARCVMAGAFDG